MAAHRHTRWVGGGGGEGKHKKKMLLNNNPANPAEFGDRYCKCCARHRQIVGSIQGLSPSLYCQACSPALCKAMVRQVALELRAGSLGAAFIAQCDPGTEPKAVESRSGPEAALPASLAE